ncbi:MAG: N-acetyltransferase [Paracoccus sp. (in: a-proteobacteria)]|nr:N-acetyltransferase [Paracoccus sp. (in: a-proteobacteria)]
MQICEEQAQDGPEVEALLDLCFAPGRSALSSYRLREGVAPVAGLCLILREAGAVRAAIRYWPVRVGGEPSLLLGPVAVHPTAQGEGLGNWLIHESLNRARAQGWARVMLVGDLPYYGRFGFARLEGVEMPPPTNPDRVLGLELTPGAWVDVAGKVTREQAPLPESTAEPCYDIAPEQIRQATVQNAKNS